MNRREFHKLSFAAAAAPLLPFAHASAPSLTPERSGGHKFTVMLGTFPKAWSFEQRLQAASDAGLDAVELINQYEQWTPEEWKKNVAKLHSLNLVVDSAVPGRNALADHTKRTALQDDLMKAIPGAKDLGCSQFIYTAYTRVPGQTPEQQRAAIVDTLKYAADVLEKDGFEIVLEPIDLLEYSQEAVPSVAEAFEIIRAVGSTRVKVLYDFYHEQRGSGNLLEKLDKNIDLVGLVHIADVPGRHHPGTGEINYDNVYRKLASLHYSRYIGLEFGYLGDPVAELIAARQQAIAAMTSTKAEYPGKSASGLPPLGSDSLTNAFGLNAISHYFITDANGANAENLGSGLNLVGKDQELCGTGTSHARSGGSHYTICSWIRYDSRSSQQAGRIVAAQSRVMQPLRKTFESHLANAGSSE